jgi:hypothetical protein
LIGAIIDTGDLVKVIWVSLVTGVGVTAVFGLAIVGGTRALEHGRDGHPVEATLFGVVGAVAMATVVAAIVLGIIVLTNK